MVTTVDTVATSVLGAEFPGVSFSIEPGITYRVRVEDDSAGVRLFIDDMTTPLLVGTAGDSFPVNRVVFYNRELGGTDTLDNVRIEGGRAIPEPCTLVLLGVAGCVCARRRRRTSP